MAAKKKTPTKTDGSSYTKGKTSKVQKVVPTKKMPAGKKAGRGR